MNRRLGAERVPQIQMGAGVVRDARTHLFQESGAAVDDASRPSEWRGECVAVVLTWRDKVGLFKRSQAVDSDRGRWHCVTGYLDPGRSPLQQAIQELHEETGLGLASLEHLYVGPALGLPDPRGGLWRVHTFRALTRERRLTLNWEHDCYRWVPPKRLGRFDGQVPWLRAVLDSTLPSGFAGGRPQGSTSPVTRAFGPAPVQ